MPFSQALPPLTRRHLLRTASVSGILAFAGPAAFAASDFWNKKEPSAWSPDEIETLKTKSPWAKKVRGEMSGMAGGRRGGGGGESMDRSGSRGTFGGMTGADSNGISAGGGGGRGGRGGGGGMEEGPGGSAPEGPEVIVRWMNARPLTAAMKSELPPELADHYAISVTGLPPQMLVMALNGGGGRGRGGRADAAPAPQAEEDPAARQKAMIERLLRSATLAAKGKDPQTADLLRQTADKQSLIFGFQKSNLPLAAGDKDVLFTMKLGPLTVKAKFEPKDMMYRGELSI